MAKEKKDLFVPLLPPELQKDFENYRDKFKKEINWNEEQEVLNSRIFRHYVVYRAQAYRI